MKYLNLGPGALGNLSSDEVNSYVHFFLEVGERAVVSCCVECNYVVDDGENRETYHLNREYALEVHDHDPTIDYIL